MMQVFGLDLQHIVELGTQVGTTGALRVLEHAADDTFEFTVGIAIAIYAGTQPSS